MAQKIIAPHLPAPTCNVEQHHRVQRLKVLAVATVFGLFAGLAGASVLVGWLWPTLGEGDAWITSRTRTTANRQQLQDRVAAFTQDTIFTLYSRNGAVTDKNVFLFGSPVGKGVGILSQGWIVAMLPANTKPNDIIAVATNGLSYVATEIVTDKSTGFSYLHIARLIDGKASTFQEQIHTAALVDSSVSLSDVAVLSGDQWYATTIIDSLAPLTTEQHDVAAPVFGMRTADMLTAGSIVFDTNGRLIGVVNKNVIVPLATSAQALTSILSGRAITRAGLGVQGWFNEERALVLRGQRTSGFLVNKVDPRTTIIKKGDILLTVNGQPFTVAAWHGIGSATSVHLSIFRSGATVEVDAPVIAE